jgi:hypothetical protein
MSFLNTAYSATVAARLTQKGRDAISKGNFVISYFAVGDSEYNYSGITTQSVFAPFDKDVNVKYPLWYTNSGSTLYGVPVQSSFLQPCRNVMPADTGWTVNVVWDQKPIGLPTNSRALTGYVSNVHTGTKEFLGYNSSLGQTQNTGTTIVNTMNEIVTITPEEQKCIALLHYTQSGITADPYRFFKYDDYISTGTSVTSGSGGLTDQQYFKVTIPTLMYHRNHSSSAGATFYMSGTTKQMVSNYHSRFTIDYRDLVDGTGATANRVGKIFFNQKTIVFDDEEIVAALDVNSKRDYTLTAPKVNAVVTNNPLTDLTTGKTIWVTYMLSNGTGSTLNGLPCNYFMKVTGQTTPHSIAVKFNSNDFTNLNNGYTANQFHILVQIVDNGIKPHPESWKLMDFTAAAGGSSLSNLITGHTFTIDQLSYAPAALAPNFLLSDYVTGTDYTSTSVPPELYFGRQRTINPGNVSVVRATDIAEMVFGVNLPTGRFGDILNGTDGHSQNPTHKSGSGKVRITEVALLNSNKEALAFGKLATPLERLGSQVIQVKIDF